jgi:hypothetical protein
MRQENAGGQFVDKRDDSLPSFNKSGLSLFIVAVLKIFSGDAEMAGSHDPSNSILIFSTQ